NGGTAVVSAGTLKIGDGNTGFPLSISTGRVDLRNNALVIDHPAGNEQIELPNVRDKIISGFNPTTPGGSDGNWQGDGITSSLLSAGSNKAIGYGEAAGILGRDGGTFRGQSADATSSL